jgi:hypothetical protein
MKLALLALTALATRGERPRIVVEGFNVGQVK